MLESSSSPSSASTKTKTKATVKPRARPRPKRVGPIIVVNLPKNTRWPNMHEWAFAVFAFLTWYCLDMIRTNPKLLAVPSFMQLAQTLITGGILAAAAWLWATNKNNSGSTTNNRGIK